MIPISAVICTYNEEDNIVPLMQSLKGMNEVIIADGGSTDHTQALAKALGATVYTRPQSGDIATQEEVDAFEKRFGWKPIFTNGFYINNGSATQKEALTHAKNDWVFFPDADERLTWDQEAVQKILENADQVECDYVHSHTATGEPESVMKLTKLYKKSMTNLGGRVHNVLIPNGRVVYTDKMRIDHYPRYDGKRSWGDRSYVLPILEYSVLKEDDARSRFYLGREYYYFKRYDEAIKLFDSYFEVATFWQEIAVARHLKALSYWYWADGPKNRGDIARESALEALRLNPDNKQVLETLGMVYSEPNSSKWKYFATHARNTDVLMPV